MAGSLDTNLHPVKSLPHRDRYHPLGNRLIDLPPIRYHIGTMKYSVVQQFQREHTLFAKVGGSDHKDQDPHQDQGDVQQRKNPLLYPWRSCDQFSLLRKNC